jgi:hypothetical protein
MRPRWTTYASDASGIVFASAAQLIVMFISQIDLSSMSNDHAVQFMLAPHFGKLEEKSMQKMDKALCLMVYYTIEELEAVVRSGKELTWETMVSKLANNLCLETDPGCPNTTRAKIFPIDQKRYFALQNREASR